MFEQEIQFYLMRGTAYAEGLSSLTLAEICSNPLLPQRLRTYFTAEASRMLEEENAYRAQSRFDHNSAEIRIIENQLDELLRPTVSFSREEYLGILERAIKISFNFLCRPQLTLRSFVFRGQEKVPPEMAIARIGYFEDYQYLTYVLKKWIEKKQHEDNLEYVTAADFERIVRKIDDQMLESFTVSDLQSLLQPMFQWIADAQESRQERIPADAFIMFFDDKNILRLSDQLMRLQNSAPAMDINDVCRVIEEMLGEGGNTDTPAQPQETTTKTFTEPEPLPTYEDVPPSLPFTGSEPEVQTENQPQNEVPFPHLTLAEETLAEERSAVAESKEESVPHIPALYDAVPDHKIDFGMMAGEALEADDDSDDIDDTEEEKYIIAEPITEIEPIPPTPGPVTTEPTVPSWDPEPIKTTVSATQFSDRTSEFKIVGANAAQPALPDLRSLIDDGERKKFIKKLFRKNDPEYEKALDAMNAMQTWKEASGYIDTLFLRNGVDPYAKQAIKFTDVVYSRFIKNPVTGRTY
ncbi:MAG TPA: hypothetical protein VFA55_06685 [Candidatus Kapabacteria bacterium]|nr:hypothetical protein [Candidatus Kapabacteria bacterium]